MSRAFNYIFCILLSFCSFFAKAQDTTVFQEEEPAVEVAPQDTTRVYETITVTTPDEAFAFDEITSVQKIQGRKIPEADVNAVKADDAYWYVNEVPAREKKKTKKPGKSIFDTGWYKTLFWIVLTGGFLALLIWFLATSNIRLFRKKPGSISDDASDEEPAENIFELNFEKEIQKAIDAKNYRMAVRLMYLQTLKELSVRNLINYTHEKTNSDYLFQLAGTFYYKNFFRLTRDFEYVWYGHFTLSDESFSFIRNDFINFKTQIS